MKLIGIKTPLVNANEDIKGILAKNLPLIKEKSIIAITSKIVSICEGRLVPESLDERQVAIKEAEEVLSEMPDYVQTVIHGIKMPNAGIDRSNANGHLVLLPTEPYKSAREIHSHLIKDLGIKDLGILITDSEVAEFHNGSIGFALAYYGFKGYKDYRGQTDLFNRKMKVSVSNVIDKLASAAVLIMGEGHEQTPIVIIEDLTMIEFISGSPNTAEIEFLKKNYKGNK